MSIISAKTAKRIALTCLIVAVGIPVLLVLLVWGSIKFSQLTDPYRFDYPEHLKTDDLRETYEQFDPNLIYLTACHAVNRGIGLEGYSGAYYRYAALPGTDTAEYLAMYEANSFFAASFTPQIVRAAGSDDHPILDGTVTAELYLRKEHARDSWSWNSDEDEHHTYGQIVYHSHVSPVTDASLLGEILTVVGTPARMEEHEFEQMRGEMLGMPPDEVPNLNKVVNPDGSTSYVKNTWGYEPVTDGQGRHLYLRLTVAEHPNIAWDAAVYVNDQGEYALRRRVYVRSSYAYDEPYAFRGDEYALYYPLSVSLDGCLPAEWLPAAWETAPETDAATESTADTAP